MGWFIIQNILQKPIERLEVHDKQLSPRIIENKDPLIRVQAEPNRLYIRPIYYKQEILSSINAIYLRKGAYLRLKMALELLPKEYSFILYDGFRPLQVQQSLFKIFSENIKKRNPRLTDEDVLQETLKYVAFPSVEPTRTSPHITGGAIDLTLGDSNGYPLELGTEFDEMSEKSATRYFEDHPLENQDALQNRRILYNCMNEVGFKNYSEEWWHYDYGNVSWARRMKLETVLYGPVLVELENNDVKEYRFYESIY
ncbi:M15 family metallopeptidase [Ureibacillus acetophenoni]|uniref:D-alanyl-D-alanine dipeptidase n=1 Tax=Ureibacillus acetophenoni TaxID=614649 RepID=A0A285U4X3_9BACL|nr:M15 family metallopeptidase [Ureibacillus acetophenoni]SOC36468.1 D-alanyl-D-alanine dipeptidase [Ureibacillus acetophenoni]